MPDLSFMIIFVFLMGFPEDKSLEIDTVSNILNFIDSLKSMEFDVDSKKLVLES